MGYGLRGFILIVVWLVAGCADPGLSPGELEPPSSEPVSRTDAFPAVVKVVGPRLCTGTIVSRHTVLSAAHCLQEPTPSIQVTGGQWLRGHHISNLGTGERNDINDIGVIVFDVDLVDTLNVTPYALADTIAPGATITMIGYGCQQRAAGTNKIFRIRDYLEVLWSRNPTAKRISGPRNRAESCSGDSGGPALLQIGEEWRVAGVLHGMLRGEPNLPPSTVYSDITRGKNRDWVKTAVVE